MGKSWLRQRSSQSMRHGTVISILLLLPLFAIAGALAPGVVTVKYQEEQEEAAPVQEHVPFRPVRLTRKPLLVPRDFSAGFIPEVLDLEQLFMGTQYRADTGKRLTRLSSFPRSQGDVIVLDDIDQFLTETLFKDVLEPGVIADATAVWDPKLFDIIPNLTGALGSDQYDDFSGQGDVNELPPIIPEPATASLLGLGLLGLALAARRQRQPTTS
jgi:PEP-CTERM motif